MPSSPLHESWRRVGDAAADRALRSVGDRPPRWLPLAGNNVELLDLPHVPQAIRVFARSARTLPEWADAAQLSRAARFADRNLPFLSVSLLAASLPFLFAGAKGAAVLYGTRRLIDDVDRRVNETGRFVLEVTEQGGFEPQGRAVIGCVSTRLVHAMVRARARGDEVAINQQDLLGTLLGFSVVALRAMKRLGARVDRADAEAWWHLWRVNGALLGIHPELPPVTHTDAGALLDEYVHHHAEPSEAGRLLTATLIDGMQRHLPLASAIPRQLVRYLLGDRLADVVGVEAGTTRSWTRTSYWLHQSAQDIVDRWGPMLARPLHSAIVARKLAQRM